MPGPILSASTLRRRITKIFRLLNQIKDAGRRCGVVLNPATPADAIKEYAHLLDKVTVMSVDPGYAGQKFIPESLNKIKQLIAMREVHGYHYLTEIDGSCNEKNFLMLSPNRALTSLLWEPRACSPTADNVSDAWDKMVDIYQREIAA